MRYAKYGSGHPRPTPLGPGMRALFAIIGIAAFVPVALIAVSEFRELSGGVRGGALFMFAFCIVVVIGAIQLLRAAIRGEAVVRRPRSRSS